MTRKIFQGYLDKPRSDAAHAAEFMGTTLNALQAVRLVSHHVRLLGVLHTRRDATTLLLVDFEIKAKA